MKRKHIVIGIPTLGTVSTRWAISYAALSTPLNTVVARIIKQGLPVDQARNDIVAKALVLDGEPTHIMWIDDDVIIHPHVLLQLLKAEKDIVSGVYFSKSEFSEPLIFRDPGHGVGEYVPGGGVQKYWGHGMGLTLVHTGVYRHMAKTLDLGVDIRGNPRWYFTSGDEPGDGLRCTEDLWFCGHAHDAGFDCWVDMSPFALGWHYEYRSQRGFPEAQWQEYLRTGTASFAVENEALERVGMSGGQLNAVIEDEVLTKMLATTAEAR